MRYKIITIFLCLSTLLYSQNISQIQFKNKPIRDILMVLAEVSGSSILVDETVSGQATYLFHDMDLESALDQFLTHYGYFYQKVDGTYHVSRILIEKAGENISLKAEDADLQIVIRRLTRDLGVTILHDALPREEITINYQKGDLAGLLDIIIKPYPQFYLEEGDNYFYLKKEESTTSSRPGTRGDFFQKQGEDYSADFKQTRFREALASLMELENKEISYLGRNDNVIEFFRHSNKDFDSMLSLLMEQGNASYQISGDIYYIIDVDRQDILKQYFTTQYIPLNHIAVDRLTQLIPSGFNASGVMKIDKDNNALLLNGNLAETAPLEKFIKSLDQPLSDRDYRRYDLQFITVDEFRKRLSSHMEGIMTVPLGSKSFLTALTDEKHTELSSYLTMVDLSVPVHPVTLGFIKWDDLKDNLPPTISKDQIHPSGDPTLVFFKGSVGELEVFKKQLEKIDSPKPQIRYEVLVLQVEDSSGLNIDNNFSIQNSSDVASTGFSGNLAGLASITFDVISQFGYQFALALSVNLTENRSRVLADTTLHGLSGEQIRFQNTNTSRHPTTAVDADTNKTEVTGYKEITSGLIIDMEGWVSGDDMITMSVQSTISSQTSNSDGEGNNIPTTSEKIINTRVRSSSGEPIIISGLKQRETVTEIKKVPILGDIPLLGLLFQKRVEALKNTEFLITLIPYREGGDNPTTEDIFSDIYSSYCQRENP